MNDLYDEDYFLHGKETGKSLYENYRWMPDLTVPMVRTMVEYLGIEKSHSVLDFGCARGYVVRAFRELGYNAWGLDTSEWAIANCDPAVRDYVFDPYRNACAPDMVDWVIAKDVLEHVVEVKETISGLLDMASVGVFAVVPLSAVDGGKYTIRSYEKDVTHLHRLTLATWAGMFTRPGWDVTLSYRVPGIKDNYYRPRMEAGNGFITARFRGL